MRGEGKLESGSRSEIALENSALRQSAGMKPVPTSDHAMIDGRPGP
jgi:hypothetical protein